MTKTISSPVERWPGEIVLHDPLTLPMVAEVEDAYSRMSKKEALSARFLAFLPGIMACVKDWHLDGGFPERPTASNFPTGPIEDRNQLMGWLINEVIDLWNEAVQIPNG
jgi:hypothetical protein